MIDMGPGLESRIASLERLVANLDQRLRTVEGAGAVAIAREAVSSPGAPVLPSAATTDLADTLGLVGRTFVIFGGAYLLRALTEAGAIGTATGVACGLAYAAAWSLMAWRVARTHALSATFLGACTPILALPLVVEASTRFGLLDASSAAAALAAISALSLAVAWHRSLHVLAWVATLGACGTSAVLLVRTGGAIPFTGLLAGLGVATLWLGYDREWKALRWVAAAAADLAVAGLAGRALTTPPRDAPALVMTIQLGTLVAYLGSIGVRTLVRGRNVVPFEVAQTGVLLLVALAGAMVVSARSATGTTTLGASLLALSAASYAVAFAFIDRREGRGASFYFYTSLAIVFALAGSSLVLRGSQLALLWAGLAAVCAWTGVRFDRRALTAHSVAYVTAAAFASGLAALVAGSLFGPAAAAGSAVPTAAWIAMAAVAVCLTASAYLSDRAGRLAQCTLAVLATAGVAGLVVALGARVLAATGEPSTIAALVATVRTGVLALGAMALAALGRRAPTAMFGVLLYPVLAIGAVKLLVEDVRTSPPSLLFAALALYGAALIVGPRLARGRQRRARPDLRP